MKGKQFFVTLFGKRKAVGKATAGKHIVDKILFGENVGPPRRLIAYSGGVNIKSRKSCPSEEQRKEQQEPQNRLTTACGATKLLQSLALLADDQLTAMLEQIVEI